MQTGESTETIIQDCLKNLGISLLIEWDAAIFLYRHGTTLASAGQIARLLGYRKAEMGEALERLESIWLVRRSRSIQGVRMYQFTAPSDPSVRKCFQELISVAETRPGRLLLVINLRRIDNKTRRRDGLHLA